MNNQNISIDTQLFYTGIALLGILSNHSLYREFSKIAEDNDIKDEAYIAYRAHKLGKAMMIESGEENA